MNKVIMQLIIILPALRLMLLSAGGKLPTRNGPYLGHHPLISSSTLISPMLRGVEVQKLNMIRSETGVSVRYERVYSM